MHAGAIRQLLYGCAYVRMIIHSLKLMDNLPAQTHKIYNNFCFYFTTFDLIIVKKIKIINSSSLISVYIVIIFVAVQIMGSKLYKRWGVNCINDGK